MEKLITVKGSDNIRWMVNADYAPYFLSEPTPRPKKLLRSDRREIIKTSEVRTIFSTSLREGGRELPVVIKIYKHRKLGDWIKANLLGSKARNEWRLTTAALNRKLNTVIPVAFGEKRSGGILKESYLLTKRLFNCLTLEEALFSEEGEIKAGKGQRRILIGLLADLLRDMHDRGVYHRDLHLGNFLVEELESGEISIYLLDLHRANLSRSLSLNKRIKSLSQFNMFATISLSNGERLLFFDRYFRGKKEWQKEKRRLIETINGKTERMRCRLWKHRHKRCTRNNRYFKTLLFDGLRGFARRGDWSGEIGEILLNSRKLKTEGKLIKESRSKEMWEYDIPLNGRGRRLFIKHYKRKRGLKAFKYLWRKSQALRSWDGAYALEMRNIKSPRAIAALDRRGPLHKLEDAYFVSEKITGAKDLVTVAGETAAHKRESRSGRRLLLKKLAFFLRRLHLLGIYHGDMKATNVLLRRENNGSISFFITDLDHVKPVRRIRNSRIVRNLYQLNKSFLDLEAVSLFDRYLFLKHYLGPYRRGGLMESWSSIKKLTEKGLKKHRRNFYRSLKP